jgi:hypothetical protein
VAGRKLQAESNQAAARTPCWDRPYAPAQLARAAVQQALAAAATPSRSPAAQQARLRRQRPAPRFDPAAPNPAVARTPCSDLPDAQAAQPAAAWWQRLVAAVAREQRPRQAQVRAEVEAQAAAQQRLSSRRVQPARAASSPAAARRPCSDRHAAPARRRQPEPAAAAREQQSAEVPAQAEAQAAAAQRRRRQAQPAPAASSLAAVRRPCSDLHAAPARRRQPEPVAAAREQQSAEGPPVQEQRSVQAEARVQAQVALVRPRPS